MSERNEKARRSEQARRLREELSPLREAAESQPQTGVLLKMREWLDALVIAFVLAMFVRTFVVELFKIPSGSMSPTLLGDPIAEGLALDSKGQEDYYLLILDRNVPVAQVFRKNRFDKYYVYEGKGPVDMLTPSQRDLVRSSALHIEEHRIFVNKFAYWFSKPDRGDIVVFKVPFKKEPGTYERNGKTFPVREYNRNQGVYVKRAVGFGGERVEIRNGQLTVDGTPVLKPEIFEHVKYVIPDTLEYDVKVPSGQLFVFGDNSDNSLDSRYWGGVPYENLRGKAFFRYWPWQKMRFLNN